MSTSQLTEAAEHFVLSHPCLHEIDRDALLRQTMLHLTNKHYCSKKTASLIAARAIAYVKSKGIDGFIDIANSTSNCVFITVKGQVRVLGLNDLVELIESEPQTA